MALIAAGIWVGGRPRRAALIASLLFAALLWVFGQAFGMLLMAMTTDPNTAPLLVALALYAWPREAPASGGAASVQGGGGRALGHGPMDGGAPRGQAAEVMAPCG
jgi:hypothetical protein